MGMAEMRITCYGVTTIKWRASSVTCPIGLSLSFEKIMCCNKWHIMKVRRRISVLVLVPFGLERAKHYLYLCHNTFKMHTRSSLYIFSLLQQHHHLLLHQWVVCITMYMCAQTCWRGYHLPVCSPCVLRYHLYTKCFCKVIMSLHKWIQFSPISLLVAYSCMGDNALLKK